MVIVCHHDNENNTLTKQPTWTKIHYACRHGNMAVIQKLGTFELKLAVYYYITLNY